MSGDEYSPVVRALFGESDEPDHEVPCCRCGTIVMCPGFIWASVRLWNRQENTLADAAGVLPSLITSREILCCLECLPEERAQRTRDYMLVVTTTEIYLRQLKAGVYNPESLAWLRKHGHASDVHRVLSEEGNKR